MSPSEAFPNRTLPKGHQWISDLQQLYLLMARMSEALAAILLATATARPGEKKRRSTSSPDGHLSLEAEHMLPPTRANASSKA